MPAEIGLLSGILSSIAGGFFLVVVGIVIRRFWQTRLWMTFLRALHFLLFTMICWVWPAGFLAPDPAIALQWYQFLVFLFPCAVLMHILYLVHILYGQAREHVVGVALLFVGMNCTMVFFPTNITVVFAVDLQTYYLSLSPMFILTNLVLGGYHFLLNARVNIVVIRRPDVSRRNKGKFFLFTAGSSVMNAGFVAVILGAMLFSSGVLYLWLAVACVLSLSCTWYGLFYANSGVFQLPIRVHLLVIFGSGGAVLYKKWFSMQASESAALLPPAAASIAGLADDTFCRARQARLLSLQDRQILFEWRDSTGAMLIADHDSGIFRNSLRQLLLHADELPGHPQEFERLVERVFNYYPLEPKNSF